MIVFAYYFLLISFVLAQVPLYLRTPAIPTYAVPQGQLQCAEQCMPSCLPTCLLARQEPVEIAPPVPEVAASPSPLVISSSVVTGPLVPSIYQPYGPPLYYPIAANVPVQCVASCMPTCAPSCVAPAQAPQEDELPTPPPEELPTPPPETTTDVAPSTEPTTIPCKCLIKITITTGTQTTSKCGPNSCTCPSGYTLCGSNCCKR
ncbi:unnamed protein product [Caenorhabditis bovis]|uniref:WAP domain-containing protein n=1 Tax=Caenorhabditis bovis TaxID=2654633 RepID=A0A8S1EHY2_9PELO|nr:unnamed protein product [Caenorhabditis bovis]